MAAKKKKSSHERKMERRKLIKNLTKDSRTGYTRAYKKHG